MLTCHSCIRRCLQTIIGRPTPFNTLNPSATARAPRRSLRRTFASGTFENSQYQKSSPARGDNDLRNIRQRSGVPPNHQKSYQRDPSARSDADLHIIAAPSDRLPSSRFEQNRQEWLKSRGVRPPSKRPSRRPNLDTESAMRKHFEYLQDPLKLSTYIRRTLRDDDFETAEKVVHYASKTLQCVVSWNHLVDWQLTKGRMNAAIKTFNDMKKRAQVPDAHTYTIIFRGCAEHKDAPQALEKVLAIYHSMSADKSPVKPNTIHVNAVLKMCAKAKNMDAMFAIADHLPEKGLKAANNLTYTTILNGLRTNLNFGPNLQQTSIKQRQEAQNTIRTARQIWTDVLKRWRKGDIWIDEELVCTMGRVLLIGNDQDADDILSLIQQTMSIPRHVSPNELGSEPSTNGSDQSIEKEADVISTGVVDADLEPAPIDPSSLETTPDQSAEETSPSQAALEELEDQDEPALIPFTEPITPATPPKGVSAYPIPAQNTLSLIMAALLKLRERESPKRYWHHLLTNGLKPDAENYNAYLRTLRVNRASSETLRVLLTMPKDHLRTSTFRIAMATCLRDKNNPHAFTNSGKILDLLQSTSSSPDPKVLQVYLEIAITAPVTIKPGSSPEQEVEIQKFTHGAQISRALHRLNPSMVNLRAVLAFGDESMRHLSGKERNEHISAVLSLTQRMVSAYDVLMEKGMVPRVDYVPLSQERAKLSAFITRHKHARRVAEEASLPKYPIKPARLAAMNRDAKKVIFKKVFTKKIEEEDAESV